MIVRPRIRGFLCTTAHPMGCRKSVVEQVEYVRSKPGINGVKNALIIGCSMGYGLASRIAAGIGGRANTVGVSYEKEPSDRKTASPGWYNNLAFDQIASNRGQFAQTLNGDAFSDAIKAQVVAAIRENLGTIDLLVYSLASPVRVHPHTGETFRSYIKPVGSNLRSRTLKLDVLKENCDVSDVVLEAASDDEINSTVAVMGGEDWEYWITTLHDAGVLAADFKTIAYTYMGNELTWPVYRGGTIGRAKDDLDQACHRIQSRYRHLKYEPVIAVLKAVVTQASTAIPVVPLYFSILFKEMKEQGTHENCIQHIYRLFHEQLYATRRRVDGAGRIRMDNFEMDEAVQARVQRSWAAISSDNVHELADIEGFRTDFLQLFGFARDDVDYEQEVDPFTGAITDNQS